MCEGTTQGLGRTHRRLLGVLPAFLVGSQGPGPTRNGPYFGPQQQMQLPIGSLLASFKVGAPGVVACSRNSIKVRAGAIRYGEDRTQHSSSAKATSPIVRGKGSPRNMPTAVFAYTLRLASDHHEHGRQASTGRKLTARSPHPSMETASVIPSFRPWEAVGSSGTFPPQTHLHSKTHAIRSTLSLQPDEPSID